MCVLLFLFGLLYFTSKLVAIGMLGGSSPLVLGVYLGIEAVLLLLVRTKNRLIG